MADQLEAVIIGAVRTPTGRFQGALKSFSAPDLGALVVRESVRRANVSPEEIDEVIMGCVIPTHREKSGNYGVRPVRRNKSSNLGSERRLSNTGFTLSVNTHHSRSARAFSR